MQAPRFRIALAAALAVAFAEANAHAGSALLYSWEGGLEGWTAANVTLANSTTLGVTNGAQSLLIDNLTPGFKNDAGVATVGSGPVYDAWGQAGTRLFAGDTDVKLEFDFSYDTANSGTQAGQFHFGQFALFVNSTGVGFQQYGTGQLIGGNINVDFPRLDPTAVTDGVTLTPVDSDTVHVAIPLGVRIAVGPPSAGSFYQIGFKTNGGWPGSIDLAIDNMRVTGANIVPEPCTVALACLGMLGVAGVAMRRRN